MRSHILWILGLLLVVLALFHSVLIPPRPLLANDSPYHQIVRKSMIAKRPHGVMWSEDGYLGNGHTAGYEVYSPLRRLVAAKYYNTVLFPACVFLAGSGLYVFLVLLGLPAMAAFLGALCLMLGGHFITCVYSGHAGTYMMLAAFTWDLAALFAAIKWRSLLGWLWAGALSALVMRYQFDIGFIMLLVLGAYAIRLLGTAKIKEGLGRTVLGILMAALVFAALGSQAFFYVLGLANGTQESAMTAPKTETPLEKWDWATQWSLPCGETASLVFPGLYGWGAQSEDGPYCGAIGRSLSWPGGGMESFSLNTQGEGAVVILLALLAVSLLFRGEKNGEIIFWSAVALVALLMSYGRYFDVNPGGESGFGPYRLFYMLPKMSDMRNPIKFLYPVMISLAVLGAMGLATIVKEKKDA